MKRLDSGGTPILNVLLPVALLGVLVVCSFLTVVLTVVFREILILLVAGPLLVLLGAVGFFVVRWFINRDVDEVWHDGNSLLVRSRARQVRIPLIDIEEISYTRMRNPPKVTLRLRQAGPLGKTYSFTPSARLPIQMPPEIREFIKRVDDARRA